jgi:hypothetical protein
VRIVGGALLIWGPFDEEIMFKGALERATAFKAQPERWWA